MIAWWWVLVAMFGSWLPVIAVAAFKDDEVWDAARLVLFTASALPLLPIVWLLSTLDVGMVPLSARALEQFCRMRSADRKHPAWVFFTWKRGVIILRQWPVGSDRVKVDLSPAWRSRREAPINVRDDQ